MNPQSLADYALIATAMLAFVGLCTVAAAVVGLASMAVRAVRRTAVRALRRPAPPEVVREAEDTAVAQMLARLHAVGALRRGDTP